MLNACLLIHFPFLNSVSVLTEAMFFLQNPIKDSQLVYYFVGLLLLFSFKETFNFGQRDRMFGGTFLAQ